MSFLKKKNLFLAPMAGITSLPFRIYCREFNEDIITCTELISSKSIERLLKEGNKSKCDELIRNDSDRDKPCGIQLFGFDKESFAVATQYIAEFHSDFDYIDINMGCPARKVTRAGAGSALLIKSNFNKAKAIMKTVKRNTDQPVSIKIRLGWEKPDFVAKKYIEAAYEVGLDFVTVHTRYADDNYSSPPQKKDIERLVSINERIGIPIIFNGNIKDYLEANTYWDRGFSGVMIGRAVKANPYCLKPNEAHRIDQNEETRIKDFIKLLRLMRRYETGIHQIFVHTKFLRGIIPKHEFNHQLLKAAFTKPLMEIERCLIEERSLSSLVQA